MHHPTYQPPPAQDWIRRRARKLMRFYGVSRHQAVQDAATDYAWLVGRASAAHGGVR